VPYDEASLRHGEDIPSIFQIIIHQPSYFLSSQITTSQNYPLIPHPTPPSANMSTPKPTAKQILEEVTQAIKDITTTKQADRETIRIFTQVEKNTADDLIERLEHLPAM
jgi:hypothetical protein